MVCHSATYGPPTKIQDPDDQNEDSCGAKYFPVQRGTLHRPDFRMYIKDSHAQIVSPFHDIPLKVCEQSTSTQVANKLYPCNIKLYVANQK